MTDNKQNGYTCYESGPMAEWYERHVVQHPKLGAVRGKKWLKEELQLTGMEVSVGVMAPGQGCPFPMRTSRTKNSICFWPEMGKCCWMEHVSPSRPAVRFGLLRPSVVPGATQGRAPVLPGHSARADSLQQWTASDGIVTGAIPGRESGSCCQ
ncbi:MAG: hypothetical protein R3C12_23380 [Planctomycetaceae bacterium]